MGCFTSIDSESNKIGAVVTASSAHLESACSLVDASFLVCTFLQDYYDGKPIKIEPLKKKYSVQGEGTNVAWDLNKMTTDYGEWDGKSFDGMERNLGREDIAVVILKALIANGTCVNTITTHGQTALQVTVLAGDLVYCKELISMKADVHKKNDAGETALSLAQQWNNQPKDLSDIIKYLENFKSSS